MLIHKLHRHGARLAVAAGAGLVLSSTCTARVDMSHANLTVNDDVVDVYLPGGTIHVDDDNVLIDLPGLFVDIN